MQTWKQFRGEKEKFTDTYSGLSPKQKNAAFLSGCKLHL